MEIEGYVLGSPPPVGTSLGCPPPLLGQGLLLSLPACSPCSQLTLSLLILFPASLEQGEQEEQAWCYIQVPEQFKRFIFNKLWK